MRKDRLIALDIRIIAAVRKAPLTVRSLASALDCSDGWASERATYLSDLGLLSKERSGNRTLVSVSKSELAASLMALMTGQPLLNLEAVLTRSGMAILPVLLEPCGVAAISKRAGLSVRTVKGLLARWRKMGVVVVGKDGCAINEEMMPLRSFARKCSESRNLRILKNDYPDANIVWQWMDEFIMAIDRPIRDAGYRPAATTRLSELGKDVVSDVQYYHCSPEKGPISEEEALAQSLVLSPSEPRIRRLVRRYFLTGPDGRAIYYYAAKYGVKQRTRGLEMDAGKEKVR